MHAYVPESANASKLRVPSETNIFEPHAASQRSEKLAQEEKKNKYTMPEGRNRPEDLTSCGESLSFDIGRLRNRIP